MRPYGLLVIVLVGCHSEDGARAQLDAGSGGGADAREDAAGACVPPVPEPPAACLALGAAELRGATPFGALDLDLVHFGAGDCITISSATIRFTGACGETLLVQFPYPVTMTSDHRIVTTSFDTDARLWFQPAGAAASDTVARARVEVVHWREGETTHDIDISLTILDERFSVSPVRIQGTFCDWPYYLC